MNLNYHEMTMNEPRDSPAKRKQFLVICTVMAGAFVYSIVTAGGLTPIVVDTKILGPNKKERDVHCPGGDLIYKFARRDYSAGSSLALSIGKDANLTKPARDFPDRMYSLYLDDARELNGFTQRFAVGYLVSNRQNTEMKAAYGKFIAKKKAYEEKKKSKSRATRSLVTVSSKDLKSSVEKLWPKLPYETTTLPKNVKCGMVQFPFTNGFVSALVLQYKVLPAMRAFPAAGKNAVVMTTCSIEEEMCTHYVTLSNTSKGGSKSDVYLLGRPNTERYKAELPSGENFLVDWDGVRDMASWFIPFIKKTPSKSKGKTVTKRKGKSAADEL